LRDFFITTLEKIIGVIIILLSLGVLIGAFGAMSQNGIAAFLGVLVGGAIYVMMMGGFVYLGLGIYHNTRRTADAVERMADGGRQ